MYLNWTFLIICNVVDGGSLGYARSAVHILDGFGLHPNGRANSYPSNHHYGRVWCHVPRAIIKYEIVIIIWHQYGHLHTRWCSLQHFKKIMLEACCFEMLTCAFEVSSKRTFIHPFHQIKNIQPNESQLFCQSMVSKLVKKANYPQAHLHILAFAWWLSRKTSLKWSSTSVSDGSLSLYYISLLSGLWNIEIDEQHRNPNMINKDHHVGQLTSQTGAFQRGTIWTNQGLIVKPKTQSWSVFKGTMIIPLTCPRR